MGCGIFNDYKLTIFFNVGCSQHTIFMSSDRASEWLWKILFQVVKTKIVLSVFYNMIALNILGRAIKLFDMSQTNLHNVFLSTGATERFDLRLSHCFTIYFCSFQRLLVHGTFEHGNTLFAGNQTYILTSLHFNMNKYGW